jgi:hypothetical protein
VGVVPGIKGPEFTGVVSTPVDGAIAKEDCLKLKSYRGIRHPALQQTSEKKVICLRKSADFSKMRLTYRNLVVKFINSARFILFHHVIDLPTQINTKVYPQLADTPASSRVFWFFLK